jgi:hypothetical protein
MKLTPILSNILFSIVHNHKKMQNHVTSFKEITIEND